MRKLRNMAFVVCIVMAGIFIGLNYNQASAQEKKAADFSKVFPFSTTGGFLGFFEQTTGTVYLYDDQMKKVLFQYQIEELGKPAKQIEIIDPPPVADVY